MLSRLLKLIPWRIIKRDDDLLVSNLSLTSEVAKQRDEIAQLIAELNESADSRTIDIAMADPEPLDVEARAEYVASSAAFFKDVLEEKIMFMLSNLHKLLEPMDNDRDIDLELKGAIFFGRELLEWGNRMVNEQVANQNNNPNED